MKRLDVEKSLHFILSKIYVKQNDSEMDYNEWLFDKGLLAGDETLSEEKIEVYEKVFLTQKELDKLRLYYTEDELNRIFDKLSNYLKNRTKRPYKSHYSAMNTWVIEDVLGFKREEPLPKEVGHWNE